MPIILRDDDTSFFTSPAMLDQVYGRLWAQNIPVCLAVIPAHFAAIAIPAGTDAPQPTFFDPNIPPRYRGQAQNFPITDNPELCAYLAAREREGLIEICLHGYSHEWLEWANPDGGVLQRKLDEGRRIFDRAFPGTAIRTFIPPYDGMSAAGLDVILKAGLHVCIHPVNLPPTTPALPANRMNPQPSGGVVFTGGINHPAGDPWDTRVIDRAAPWQAALDQADEFTALVVVNHYWTFFEEWGAPDAVRLNDWEAAFDHIILPHAASITTFHRAAHTSSLNRDSQELL